MAVGAERDSTFDAGDGPNASLGDFFGRAVEIANFDWGTNVSFFESFNPWQLFFTNPRVANRLANYYSLRCDLKLKFLLNGNGFYYGRQMVSYLPLPAADSLTIARAFFKQDLVQASQRPHIFLDPTTSMGGEMTLPFFFYKNGVSVPDSEFNELGRIDMFEMAPLNHANGATGTVRITVLAWAENVVLSMPTQATALLTPQSGMSMKTSKTMSKKSRGDRSTGDEYGSGPVSYPATIVAKAAGALTQIPVIGPYARASQMAAGTMADVAKLFGYSRPASVEAIKPYVPQYAGNVASCNMIDTSVKLTTDAKQEVTIDPRTFGLISSDEMSISSVASRESYITQTEWKVSDSPGTILFNSLVTPCMWDTVYNGTNNEHHVTASCFATMPFDNWRGTMEYRFQIVTSNFHKGRLALHWDPYKVDPDELNVTYSRIIDIGEEKDFVVRVKWGQLYPYCTALSLANDSVPFINRGTLFQPTLNTSRQNGFLCLRVLNELTVPNSTVFNDVSINVFCKACDDFEVADPTSVNFEPFSFFPAPQGLVLQTQSGESPLTCSDLDCTEEPSKPMSTKVDFEVGGSTGEGDLADICYGEVIPSFRLMLKRYNFHTMWGPNEASFTGTLSRRNNHFPYMRGFAPNGVNVAAGANYNVCKMTLLNFISSAYTARRGGIRWKHMLVAYGAAAPTADYPMGVLRSERVSGELGTYEITADPWLGTAPIDTLQRVNVAQWSNGHAGMHMTPPQLNPVLEVEYPHHSNLRFYPAKNENTTRSNSYGEFHKVSAVVRVNNKPGNAGGTHIYDFVAAGEDFSLHFFTGCPILYYVPIDPS